MKRIYLPAIFCTLFLFSCDKDDDSAKPEDQNNLQAKLAGTWQCKRASEVEFDSAGNVISSGLTVYHIGGPIFNFAPQGVLQEGYFNGGNFNATAEGTYQLNGNNLTTTTNNAQVLYTGTPAIDTLTANHLSLIDTINNAPNRQSYSVIAIDAFR